MSSDRAKRAGIPPKNPDMAGGKDAADIVYDVWRCGAPRGDYPGALPGGLLARCEPWMQGRGVIPFSGMLRVPGAVHVDFDASTQPDIVGDVEHLPVLTQGELFDYAFADPPYGDEYSRAMYRTARLRREGTDGRADTGESRYKPHRWLVAISRCVRKGGHILYLDQLCPYGPAGTEVAGRFFVFRGTNMRATCLTLIRKLEDPPPVLQQRLGVEA